MLELDNTHIRLESELTKAKEALYTLTYEPCNAKEVAMDDCTR